MHDVLACYIVRHAYDTINATGWNECETKYSLSYTFICKLSIVWWLLSYRNFNIKIIMILISKHVYLRCKRCNLNSVRLHFIVYKSNCVNYRTIFKETAAWWKFLLKFQSKTRANKVHSLKQMNSMILIFWVFKHYWTNYVWEERFFPDTV